MVSPGGYFTRKRFLGICPKSGESTVRAFTELSVSTQHESAPMQRPRRCRSVVSGLRRAALDQKPRQQLLPWRTFEALQPFDEASGRRVPDGIGRLRDGGQARADERRPLGV